MRLKQKEVHMTQHLRPAGMPLGDGARELTAEELALVAGGGSWGDVWNDIKFGFGVDMEAAGGALAGLVAAKAAPELTIPLAVTGAVLGATHYAENHPHHTWMGWAYAGAILTATPK
jgi:hypothetical protein